MKTQKLKSSYISRVSVKLDRIIGTRFGSDAHSLLRQQKKPLLTSRQICYRDEDQGNPEMSQENHEIPTSQKLNPKQNASFLSLLSFWWLEKLLRLGYKQPLTGDDLPPVLEEDLSEKLVATLDINWKQELQDCRIRGARPRLWKAVVRIIPVHYLVLFVIQRLLSVAGLVFSPVLVWLFLHEINSGSSVDYSRLSLWIFLLGFASVVRGMAEHHGNHIGEVWSTRIKVATTGLIYEKV